MKTKILLVLGSVACLTMPVSVAQTRSAADLYQEALHLQEVKGDLGKAIELYRTILDRYAADQVIAPKALLEMASDYEKLGRPEAADTYRRIVRDYAGSGTIAAAAQNRLANGSQTDPGTVLRQTNYGDLDTISSDGRYSPFENKNGDLALLELASGRERVLTHCESSNECSADISVPSPDTRFIVYNLFTRARSGPEDKSFNLSGGPFTVDLRVISRDGGEPRIVYPNIEKAWYLEPAGWTPDGKSILMMLQKIQGGPSDLILLPVSGGTPRPVKHFDTRWYNVEISPDGRYIAATVPAAADKPERDIISISLDTGREETMLKHAADDYLLGWFPQTPSRILFASDRGGTYGIWAARVVDGRTEGEPMLVRRDTGRVSPVGFTRNGNYHYGVNETWREVSVATLDTATGKQIGSPVRLEGRYLGGMSAPAWSPTGDRIAYVQATSATTSSGAVSMDLSLNKKLAIQTVSTGEVRLLTVVLDNIATIVWQPDGRSLIAQGRDPQGQGLFAVNADNGAVTNIQRGGASPALSPDGRRVFFRFGPPPAAQSNEAQGIASRDLASGAQQTITTQAVSRFALSPDGKWLASTTPRVGDTWPKPYLTASSGGESRPLHPALSGWSIDPVIAWSSDSHSVFVVKVARRQPNVHEIWQVPMDGSAPRSTGITWSGEAARFEAIDAHPDGRRLAVSTVKNRWTSWVLENIPSQIGK